jgi:fumarylpyruvate hydrolase
MNKFVITPPATASIDIHRSDARFPVRRIYCLARNYRAHAIETGDNPDERPPFFFQKPADAIVTEGGDFPYPGMSNEVHFEAELVVALKSGGKNIDPAEALTKVFGYAMGLDMTRRDLQSEAIKLSRPWAAAKAFDHSAPIGSIFPATDIGHPDSGRIWLSVNGDIKQDSDISLMRWSIPEAISILSDYSELAPGDLIMTGTPEGIGAVHKGDVICSGVAGVDEIEVKVI